MPSGVSAGSAKSFRRAISSSVSGRTVASRCTWSSIFGKGGRSVFSVSCTVAERTESPAPRGIQGGSTRMARAQAQRRQTSRTRARRSSSSAEDLRFFPKLRRKAKWVFLLLAIAFALGFVAFGVGTGVGGTSIGDVLRAVFTSNGGSQDLDSLREDATKNPKDRTAQIAYA